MCSSRLGATAPSRGMHRAMGTFTVGRAITQTISPMCHTNPCREHACPSSLG